MVRPRAAPVRASGPPVAAGSKAAAMDGLDPEWAVDGGGELSVERECAAFWDDTEFRSEFGEEPAERAGDGEVCCRECGEAMGRVSQQHLAAAHGLSPDEYSRRHPVAPVEPPERPR